MTSCIQRSTQLNIPGELDAYLMVAGDGIGCTRQSDGARNLRARGDQLGAYDQHDGRTWRNGEEAIAKPAAFRVGDVEDCTLESLPTLFDVTVSAMCISISAFRTIDDKAINSAVV